jgi:3-hydroxyacyl-CoA dehydrogenase
VCAPRERSDDAGTDHVVPQSLTITELLTSDRLVLTSSLLEAVQQADIVQEQGPEKVEFKQWVWSEVETLAPPRALLWSSTSGIPASVQSKKMRDKSRLMILHPYNPPHVMPLLELVPAPGVDHVRSPAVARTISYWERLGRRPIVLKEEITGFVANRLAFALFREAAYLVERGIVSAQDVDQVVQESLGPRWAVKGPFWSYHAGGGEERGLEGFLDKIGDTIQACWDDLGQLQLGHAGGGMEHPVGWRGRLCKQVEDAYGKLGAKELMDRDEKLRDVLDSARPSDDRKSSRLSSTQS